MDEPEERPVTQELVDWADVIFAMEAYHKNVLRERFPGCQSKIVVLHIPDQFDRGDPQLVAILRKRLAEYLP